MPATTRTDWGSVPPAANVAPIHEATAATINTTRERRSSKRVAAK